MLQIGKGQSFFIHLKRFVDAVLPLMMLYFIAWLYKVDWADRYVVMGLLAGISFVMANQFVGTYDNWRTRSPIDSMQLVSRAWAFTVLLLIFLAFVLKITNQFSRLVTVTWIIFMPLVFYGQRVLFRAYIRHYYSQKKITRRIAIVGAGEIGRYLFSVFEKNPCLGYKVVCFYDYNSSLHGQTVEDVKILGGHKEAADDARNGKFEELFLCLPLDAEKNILNLLDDLSQSTTVVKYVPDLFAFDLLHAKWIDIQGIPVISVYDSPMSSASVRLVKRIEDIFIASLILLLIWPIMIVIALGVKITSPGPVFYKQNRIGWNKKPFAILKFRSMLVDSEREGVVWGEASKKKQSSFGSLLRRTSLDELPQFINVLRGDMSIVGPRPERDIFVEKIGGEVPRYMQRHMVKAGITGWAQINGWRGDTCLKKRVEYDLYYINNWSLWLDLKIILLTAFKGWRN